MLTRDAEIFSVAVAFLQKHWNGSIYAYNIIMISECVLGIISVFPDFNGDN
jgi:hypothetical protein